MLKNIPKILSPELIKTLCEMGHTDSIVLGDGNFTGQKFADEGKGRLIRADGIGAVALLDAILQIIPLQKDCDKPVKLMACDQDLDIKIWDEYKKVVNQHYPESGDLIEFYERGQFYQEAKKAYAIIQTGEEAIYANVIISKGVIE